MRNVVLLEAISFPVFMLGGIGILILIYYLLSKVKLKPKQKSYGGFYQIYTPNGLQLIKKLEEMRDNNLSLRMIGEVGIYEEIFGKIQSSPPDGILIHMKS